MLRSVVRGVAPQRGGPVHPSCGAEPAFTLIRLATFVGDEGTQGDVK